MTQGDPQSLPRKNYTFVKMQKRNDSAETQNLFYHKVRNSQKLVSQSYSAIKFLNLTPGGADCPKTLSLPQSLKDSKIKTFKMLFFEPSRLRGSICGNVFTQSGVSGALPGLRRRNTDGVKKILQIKKCEVKIINQLAFGKTLTYKMKWSDNRG